MWNRATSAADILNYHSTFFKKIKGSPYLFHEFHYAVDPYRAARLSPAFQAANGKMGSRLIAYFGTGNLRSVERPVYTSDDSDEQYWDYLQFFTSIVHNLMIPFFKNIFLTKFKIEFVSFEIRFHSKLGGKVKKNNCFLKGTKLLITKRLEISRQILYQNVVTP